jgi:predicted double-glycine peptidase
MGPQKNAPPTTATGTAAAPGAKRSTRAGGKTADRLDAAEIAPAVHAQLAPDYPADAISWVPAAHWKGPGRVALERIDFSGKERWVAYHDPVKVAAHKARIEAGIEKPIILVQTPNSRKLAIIDGHHRGLAYLELGKSPKAYIAKVGSSTGSWDKMHDAQREGELESSAQTPRDDGAGSDEVLPLPLTAIGVPPMRQASSFGCGAAAALSLMKFWGLKLPPAESDIYSALGTTEKDGTDTQPIAEHLKKLGLEADYRQGTTTPDLERALSEGTPVLLCLQAWGNGGTKPGTRNAGHCVILVGADADRFYFVDPSVDGGYSWLAKGDLEARWHDTTAAGEKRDHEAIFVRGKGLARVDTSDRTAIRMDARAS